jgi:hypothetical protein
MNDDKFNIPMDLGLQTATIAREGKIVMGIFPSLNFFFSKKTRAARAHFFVQKKKGASRGLFDINHKRINKWQHSLAPSRQNSVLRHRIQSKQV